MFVLVRAVAYAAFFIGFVLVYLPGRFLAWSGIVRPAVIGAPHIAGMIIADVGAAIALLGAALFFRSLSILIYAGVFFLATHLFVVLYEEPTLRRTFGVEYEDYCGRVRRWWVRPGRVAAQDEG